MMDLQTKKGLQSEKLQRRNRIRKALVEKARERFNELQQKSNNGNNLNEQQIEPTSLSTSSYLAPISPTPRNHISVALQKLHLNSESLLIDIGCGDGRWLIESCLATKCRSVGVDVDPDRLLKARAVIDRHGLNEKIALHQRDGLEFLRNSSLVLEASTLILYLFRDAMKEVSGILRDRLIGNSEENDDKNCGDTGQLVQILSIGFKLPGFTITWQQTLSGLSIYLYHISKPAAQANSYTEQKK
mmetsp:Transcript_9096/g.14002  ORF Transcript_9096/g.14002 Transcript_9096/m.14002 type:complete len:244 (-) Transcript_9096:345-1076(-)